MATPSTIDSLTSTTNIPKNTRTPFLTDLNPPIEPSNASFDQKKKNGWNSSEIAANVGSDSETKPFDYESIANKLRELAIRLETKANSKSKSSEDKHSVDPKISRIRVYDFRVFDIELDDNNNSKITNSFA